MPNWLFPGNGRMTKKLRRPHPAGPRPCHCRPGKRTRPPRPAAIAADPGHADARWRVSGAGAVLPVRAVPHGAGVEGVRTARPTADPELFQFAGCAGMELARRTDPADCSEVFQGTIAVGAEAHFR